MEEQTDNNTHLKTNLIMEATNYQIINYSDKAIALVGETKTIKEQLKAIGGRFNARLTCGAGWIFPIKMREEVEALINGEEVKPVERKDTPRVYCGTYGKYSRGSIAGGWIDIAKYASGEDVLKACAALHRDEADPEFMFQDYENFPMWFYSESMGASAFDEVLAWWKEEQSKPREKSDEVIEAYVAEMGGDDYYRRKVAKVVRLSNGGFFSIDKDSIKTRFCFHDEGPDYELYKSLTAKNEGELKDYFIGENLNKYDNEIKKLAGKDGKPHDWRLFPEYDGKNVWTIADFYDLSYHLRSQLDKAMPMTDSDKHAILNALNEVRTKMEKRLEAWWKRYGAKKIYMWTYWADA